MTMSTTRESYVDIATAAEYLDVTERTIRRWLEAKKIPGYQIGGFGGQLRFRLSELDQAVRGIGAAVGH